MDHGALDHWQHEDSLDGLADFVFWGRDAGRAREGDGRTGDVGGLRLDRPDGRGRRGEEPTAPRGSRPSITGCSRPTSARTRITSRRSPPRARTRSGAGTIEVGGAQICLFFTSWGDGVFPIYLDLDDDERPVRVRIQLASDASDAAMRAVN